MDLGVLRVFAVGARVGLVGQMGARVGQLLADPNVGLEYPGEMAALRAAVKAHGEDGVAQIAAYTWFNRLTAARFMDVNGFSGRFAVVSPEVGSASVLPQILTRAQAGEFPDEVPQVVRAAVMDVLSGSRVSADPDLEAYGLLLGAVFRAWHEPMPEVFPAAVDWIRLLTPPDILAPGSVRARAVAVLDERACANVEVVGWLYQFYIAELKEQINESKKPIDASTLAPVTQLFTPHWIVRYLVENSLSRLWLRSRPSSRLRERMDYFVEPVVGQQDTGITVSSVEEIRVLDPACGSGHMLTYAFDLLYAIYEEEGYAPGSIPELILTHNLRGLEIDDRAAQLASFALAMKARACDQKFLQRGVQPDIVWIQPVAFDEPSVRRIVETVTKSAGTGADAEALTRLLYAFVEADSFGSLIRVDSGAVAALEAALPALEDSATDLYASHDLTAIHILVRQAIALVDDQYHVVVANPPYIGRKHMGHGLASFAEQFFPLSQFDTYAMFIERAVELVPSGGVAAMVTMHGWMFLSSYFELRRILLNRTSIRSLAHLGAHAFDAIPGEVVQTSAFVIDRLPSGSEPGIYYRLLAGTTSDEKSRALITAIREVKNPLRFEEYQNSFTELPDSIISYWMSESARSIFAHASALSGIGVVTKGMTSGNNDIYLREWSEVSRSTLGTDGPKSGRWLPYNKGGKFRKWWGNRETVIDSPQFASIMKNGWYFQEAATWGTVSPGAINARSLPGDSVSDNGGSVVVPADSAKIMPVLGLLNSTVAHLYLESLAPTINNQPGYVGKLPWIDSNDGGARRVVDELVSLFRSDWDDFELSWDFVVNPLVALGSGLLESLAELRWDAAVVATGRAQELEEQNNRYFAGLYGLEGEVECAVPLSRVSLTQNPYFRYAPNKGASRTEGEYRALFFADVARELISYGVGCIMGRYSLDKPGLVLADAGSTAADFERVVPDARLRPDADGILVITAEPYFEDDIVVRLCQFLAVAFGEENLEANLVWLETALGGGKRKSLRDYFLADFYNDHIKTYSKRPIYWQVSSPKGGFNALFYLHRYTPATLGVIHQSFAEELLGKIEARLDTIDHAMLSAGKGEAVALGKERDGLTAQRREVREWIDSALFPLASTETRLDLDDGVKQNYPKLAGVVKKVTGL